MRGGRCRLHGGASLAGIASPTFRTGRHSKDLPAGLLDRYQLAHGDKTLIGLRDEVALVDARTGTLLQRLDGTGAGAAGWKSAAGHLTALKDAIAAGGKDPAPFKAALAALDACIGKGIAEASLWTEILHLVNMRRKLVDTESRRLKTLHQMVTTDQAMAFVSALATSVREHVKDRKALAAIQSDIARLLARPGGIPAADIAAGQVHAS